MNLLKPLLTSAMLTGTLGILFVTACTLDDGFIAEPEIYACSNDSDCEPTFKCQLGRCVDQNKAIPCTDEDGDGAGVGDERGECELNAIDIDDTCAECYTGALELCDGKFNGIASDMPPTDAQEEISCDKPIDCGDLPESVKVTQDGKLEMSYTELIDGQMRSKVRQFDIKGSLPADTNFVWTCVQNKCRMVNVGLQPPCNEAAVICSGGQYDVTPVESCQPAAMQ